MESGTQKAPKTVLEARLRFKYVDPTTGRKDEVIHPRAVWKGKEGHEVVSGGEQIYGPGIALRFDTWTVVGEFPPEEGKDRSALVNYLRTDPVERARVEFRARPASINALDILSDPGIPKLTAEEYVAALRKEAKRSSDDVEEKPVKRGPGRPPKGR
jgi:hypothetical protein